MTTALVRNVHLTDNERAALTELGIDTNQRDVAITITADTSWLNLTEPHAWIADWHTGTDHTDRDDSGTLDELPERIQAITDDPEFNREAGLSIEICRWHLWVNGHLS